MSRVAVTGASGLIGSALVEALEARGDTAVRLVRRAPTQLDEVRWDPTSRTLDPATLDGVDAVVNLAGAGIADKRWTTARKREILTSRVDGTHALSAAIAASGRPVRLVNGSAIGFYGSRGDEVLTEDSPGGTGFTAEVTRAWEASAAPAVDAGAPVAYARTGLVMAPNGGAMERVLPLARLGLGGPLGSGRQFWPWITLVDEVRALLHLIDHPELTGPVNLVVPLPARQRDFMKALGAALHRPAVLPAPSVALRIALGGFASEVLDSHRVIPTRLETSGFTWEHDSLADTMSWVLSQD